MTKKIVGAVVVFGLLGGLSVFIWALTNNKIVIGYNKDYEPISPFRTPTNNTQAICRFSANTVTARWTNRAMLLSRHSTCA